MKQAPGAGQWNNSLFYAGDDTVKEILHNHIAHSLKEFSIWLQELTKKPPLSYFCNMWRGIIEIPGFHPGFGRELGCSVGWMANQKSENGRGSTEFTHRVGEDQDH